MEMKWCVEQRVIVVVGFPTTTDAGALFTPKIGLRKHNLTLGLASSGLSDHCNITRTRMPLRTSLVHVLTAYVMVLISLGYMRSISHDPEIT